MSQFCNPLYSFCHYFFFLLSSTPDLTFCDRVFLEKQKKLSLLGRLVHTSRIQRSPGCSSTFVSLLSVSFLLSCRYPGIKILLITSQILVLFFFISKHIQKCQNNQTVCIRNDRRQQVQWTGFEIVIYITQLNLIECNTKK